MLSVVIYDDLGHAILWVIFPETLQNFCLSSPITLVAAIYSLFLFHIFLSMISHTCPRYIYTYMDIFLFILYYICYRFCFVQIHGRMLWKDLCAIVVQVNELCRPNSVVGTTTHTSWNHKQRRK